MPTFRYVKEGDAVAERGQTHRVLAEDVAPYLVRHLDGTDELPEGKTVEDLTPDEAYALRADAEKAGATFKFKEVRFSVWARTMPDEWRKDGKIIDPEYGELDSSTGEPMTSASPAPADETAPDAVATGEEPSPVSEPSEDAGASEAA